MKFSSLTEKTFDFIESCCKEELRPIFILAPSKRDFALSISIKILQKRWIEDLDNQQNPYIPGDKINITIPPNLIKNKKTINLYAEVTAVVNNSKVELCFNPDDKTPTKYGLYINFVNKYGIKINKNVKLSKGSYFIKNIKLLRESDISNNPWANFLGVKSPVTHSQLPSKIYLITGRGKVEFTRSQIEVIEFKDAIKGGLIVKESLKDFAESLRKDYDSQLKINSFCQIFNSIFSFDFEIGEENLNKYLISINEILNQRNLDFFKLRSTLFQFMGELIDYEYSDEQESLNNIVKEFLPESSITSLDFSFAKGIIIDGIDMIDSYTDLIKKLLILKIPVIVLSDYSNYNVKRKELTSNFFRSFSNVFILNWNNAKIAFLDVLQDDAEFIDKEALNLCKKYFNQSVTIQGFCDDSKIIDIFFNAIEIRLMLFRIDGFEGIKNIYSIYLRPVVYCVKNSPGPIIVTEEMINSVITFQSSYEKCRDQLKAYSPLIVSLFDRFLDLFYVKEGLIFNSKKIGQLPDGSFLFEQGFNRLSGRELQVDRRINGDTKNTTIVFSGTPFEETKFFYLRKALFESFDSVYFLGFCREAENMYKNLFINTVTFNNKINDTLPNDYNPFWDLRFDLKTNTIYLNEECSEFENGNDQFKEEIDFDKGQDLIDIARYQIDHGSDGTSDDADKDSKVAVNILELDGNKSVFMKKAGARKLLVLKGNGDFVKAEYDEINPGDRVFTYFFTRQDTLAMRGENSVDESVFQDLDIWFEMLKKLWNEFDQNYTVLSEMLINLKEKMKINYSNPEPSNLRNWMHKDRIINAPEEENLKLILYAAKTPNVEEEFKKIMNAKKKVEKLDRHNRENIKLQIEKFINRNNLAESDNFSIMINSISIIVNHGIVKHKIEPFDLKMEHDKIGIVLSL
jgi:hypothetical protein